MFTRINTSVTSESRTVNGVYLVARIEDDYNPDTSYLDQEEWGDCFDRKKAYENGEFSFVGVTVTAYDDDDKEVGYAGLWGIESDSEPSYFALVANDLADEVLAAVGMEKLGL